MKFRPTADSDQRSAVSSQQRQWRKATRSVSPKVTREAVSGQPKTKDQRPDTTLLYFKQ
jgi:hypothetical protein